MSETDRPPAGDDGAQPLYRIVYGRDGIKTVAGTPYTWPGLLAVLALLREDFGGLCRAGLRVERVR